jgi:hypothetical protein
MEKIKYIFILIIITFVLPNVVIAQTTEQNQNTACNNKANGQDCSYKLQLSGRDPETTDTMGKCDRRGDGRLYCNSTITGWEDCFDRSQPNDACKDKASGKIGACVQQGSGSNFTCDTDKPPTFNPGDSTPGGMTISCVTNSEKDNKCGTNPKCSTGQVCANVDGTTKCVTNAEKDNKCGTGDKCTGNQVCVSQSSPSNGSNNTSSSTANTSSATTTAGTVSYESYTNFPGVGRISSLCQLITALWYLGFAVLLTSVLGMFLWGGYIYVTAGVNAGKVNQAKEIFTNTITGLIIGLSIFIIINVINPGLLQGNCSIPSVGSGSTLGGGGGTSNIVPKPGESVFPTTCDYEGPGPLQSFGAPRDGGSRRHAGIDFTPPSQSTQCPILAFRDGTVTTVYNGFIAIKHADGIETRYIHNSTNFVTAGQEVKAGQQIGNQGNVGTGAVHLHFEIYNSSGAVNPAGVLLDGSKNPDPSKVKVTGNPRSTGGGL